MNISLTDDLSAFLADQVKDGGYKNKSEVIREGLRLLRLQRDKRTALRQAIAIGDADIAAGRTAPLTSELLRDIAERGKQMARNRKNS
jgi:putative addiction module CopG family antidote